MPMLLQNKSLGNITFAKIFQTCKNPIFRQVLMNFWVWTYYQCWLK